MGRNTATTAEYDHDAVVDGEVQPMRFAIILSRTAPKPRTTPTVRTQTGIATLTQGTPCTVGRTIPPAMVTTP